ncbi:uncharacterized protein EDB93DRAFT_1114262 [Suillus bovinus]|uniref:uncharacterized protein n=1 Tax=Suillus bovinus TaxID=48563 RepID=UPI001B880CA8|nr:uncharacterized protein EDB93DRAFT_1114262 [Suillus bovinus]KAG2160249.1 hypothetical protein EDB93DRAFT_1114262 [Suillus bovinus]
MAMSDKFVKTSNEVAPPVTGSSISQPSVLRTPDMTETMWPSHLTCHQTPGPTNEYTERGHASSDDASPTRPVNGLLPPFSSQHVHLPTPLSPSNLGVYGQSSSRNITPKSQILLEDIMPTDSRSISYHADSSPTFRPHKMITPDSSPLAIRSRANGPHGKNDERSHSPPRITRRMPPTGSANGSVGGTEEHSPSLRICVAQDNTCSAATQQSMEVMNTTQNRKRPASQASSADFLPPSNSISLPPSASQELSEEVGGEMARIRAQLLENQISLTREAEARRPDYLKRAKRIESPPPLDVDGIEGQRATATIGVTESPIKGRRLMLFQQTSDESFEESLMAGGYDRYRTDLQRSGDPVDPDASGELEALPLVSEQELRQQNRLSAFRSSSHVPSRSKLAPVDVEGYGRVLMDIGPSDPPSPNKLSPSKKRRYRKKKKTPSMDESKDQSTFPLQLEANVDVPNWPDTQFPWRLRSEQCSDFSKMKEEQRLRYIENFLNRDSDDEDDEESLFQNQTARSRFGSGRGKMYPLFARSQNRDCGPTTVSVVPSDPADARTALLSKRSIRQFSFRRAQRKSTDDDIDDEIVCICRGSDDGRELVQCDECHTWYHLQCIGIRSVADLGKEEDPWFCGSCAKTPPPDILPSFEPTFVPTEEKLRHDKSYDPPFFHPGLNPSPAVPWSSSPRPPMTPPGRRAGPYFSSGSSWDEASSQPGPQTPQLSSRSVRVYTTTPGCAELFMADESPFDPTSTPSRGIKFGAPFATPKNNFWQGRGPELFHTPTRPGEGMSNRRSGHHLLGGADDSQLPITHLSSGPDITPIGRNFAPVGRLAESPLAAKNLRRGPGGGRFLNEHFDSARGGRRS